MRALAIVVLFTTVACSGESANASDTPKGWIAVGARDTIFALPSAIGHMNDFAQVVPDSTRRFIDSTLQRIRTTTEGEVVVVTLRNLGTNTVESIARRIGIEWGVGAQQGPARHAGTVVLIIPKETSDDGRGHCRIELGVGANQFIADSMATSICQAATPAFRAQNYGEGLRSIVLDLERRYRQRFGA